MQTTLQRCPRNSVEQLGQIDDASLRRLAGAVIAGNSVAELSCPGGILEPDGGLDNGGVELMSGFVAQIEVDENIVEESIGVWRCRWAWLELGLRGRKRTPR